MSKNTAVTKSAEWINGVNVDQLMHVIGEIETDTNYAQFQFRAKNQWIDGGLTRSTIKDFHAGNTEDKTRTKSFIVDADEPQIAAGKDSAPNAMEYMLHALASCLTGTLVYHAAVRGIRIEAVESEYTGDMDVRGLFGMSEEVRKGFNNVTVTMKVKSEVSVEELTELAMFSPVYEMYSRAIPVNFSLTTY